MWLPGSRGLQRCLHSRPSLRVTFPKLQPEGRVPFLGGKPSRFLLCDLVEANAACVALPALRCLLLLELSPTRRSYE